MFFLVYPRRQRDHPIDGLVVPAPSGALYGHRPPDFIVPNFSGPGASAVSPEGHHPPSVPELRGMAVGFGVHAPQTLVKGPCMVHLLEVAKLVQDHVPHQARGKEEEPRIQVDIALCRTASPAAFHLLDRDPPCPNMVAASGVEPPTFRV